MKAAATLDRERHQVTRMRPRNATIDLDATPDKVWDIFTATQAYDNPYPGRCGSVDEDASFTPAQAALPPRPSRLPWPRRRPVPSARPSTSTPYPTGSGA